LETWTAVGHLWCAVEVLSGRRQQDYGADRPGTAATIRVRNWPALSALDRLSLGEWGETWVIESVRRGDNELVVEAHQFDGGAPA
jgi:head-tail adaptor